MFAQIAETIVIVSYETTAGIRTVDVAAGETLEIGDDAGEVRIYAGTWSGRVYMWRPSQDDRLSEHGVGAEEAQAVHHLRCALDHLGIRQESGRGSGIRQA